MYWAYGGVLGVRGVLGVHGVLGVCGVRAYFSKLKFMVCS